jgi:hypothetical protein
VQELGSPTSTGQAIFLGETFYLKFKGQVVPVHAMKAYGGAEV